MRKEKRLWMIVLKHIEYYHKRGTRGICNLLMTLWYQKEITTDEYEFLKVSLRRNAREMKIIGSLNQHGFFWLSRDLESRVNFIKQVIKTI